MNNHLPTFRTQKKWDIEIEYPKFIISEEKNLEEHFINRCFHLLIDCLAMIVYMLNFL